LLIENDRKGGVYVSRRIRKEPKKWKFEYNVSIVWRRNISFGKLLKTN